ncbi:hypothetical protein RRG08_029983 [Elysia crispata]|uniref:Major facilitator superfamily (MFS) profile domain-containing protein n=1 Tax=Elysia crispata TaxID=231223 RepID=A0AAE0ZJ72_9GAST|nr:hypothetical protein RRG08_029983 [Elysia crispata]
MPSSSEPSRLLSEEEHRRKWLVLAASFLILLINASLSYHVGVLNVAVTDRFTEAGEQTISWLMAIYASLFALGAPVGSAVINLSNARTCIVISGLMSFVAMVLSSFVTRIEWLFFTLTLAGLGQGLSHIGGCVGLAYYFPDKTALASGIAVSGGGAGNFVHPALTQLLIEEYNLQGTFLILGAFCLQTCALGLLIRPTSAGNRLKQERKRNNESTSFSSSVMKAWQRHVTIFRNTRYVVLLIAVFIFAVAFQAVIVYLPEYLINSKGYSPLEAATMASCIGIGTLFSRSLVGFAATDPNIGLTVMFAGMTFVTFLVCLTAEAVIKYTAGAYIITLANGIYASSTQILLFPLTIAILGHSNCEAGFGMVLLVLGSGCLLGPPLAAWILGKFGYSMLFRFSAALYLVSAILVATTHQTQEKEITNNANGEEVHSRNPADVTFGSQYFEIIVPAKEAHKEAPRTDVEVEEAFLLRENEVSYK